MIVMNTREMEIFLARMAREFNASREQIEKAKISALKDVRKGMFNAGLKLVREHFALKDPKGRYTRSVTLSNPTTGKPYLEFRAKGRVSLHLSDFKTTGKKPRAFSVQVLKSGPKTLFEKIAEHNGGLRTYKSFMMAGKHSGKQMLVSRDPERSYAARPGAEGLRVFFGPGIIPFLAKDENRQYLLESTFERFQKRFEHNLESLMKGRWAKRKK